MTFLQAYLDPASGGIILQVIVGGLAAVGVTMKLYWRRIKRFLRIGQNQPREAEATKTDGS